MAPIDQPYWSTPTPQPLEDFDIDSLLSFDLRGVDFGDLQPVADYLAGTTVDPSLTTYSIPCNTEQEYETSSIAVADNQLATLPLDPVTYGAPWTAQVNDAWGSGPSSEMHVATSIAEDNPPPPASAAPAKPRSKPRARKPTARKSALSKPASVKKEMRAKEELADAHFRERLARCRVENGKPSPAHASFCCN